MGGGGGGGGGGGIGKKRRQEMLKSVVAVKIVPLLPFPRHKSLLVEYNVPTVVINIPGSS